MYIKKAEDTKISGPFTLNQIAGGLQSKKLTGEELVAEVKDGPWKKLSQTQLAATVEMQVKKQAHEKKLKKAKQHREYIKIIKYKKRKENPEQKCYPKDWYEPVIKLLSGFALLLWALLSQPIVWILMIALVAKFMPKSSDSTSYTPSYNSSSSVGSDRIDYNSYEFRSASEEVQQDAMIYNTLRNMGYDHEESVSAVVKSAIKDELEN